MSGILGAATQKALGAPVSNTATTAASLPTSVSAPASLKKSTRESEIVREQQKAAARKRLVLMPAALDDDHENADFCLSGLQRSLVELETFAGSTSTRLNDTYYSVLEKLGTLQNTIGALKELAELSNQTNTSFSTESDALVDDFSSQLDALGQFEEQQERIASLQERIYTGRESIKSLSERVDIVRERIENWERADREWQEKIRKRLKVLWVVSSIVFLLLISLFVGAQYASESLDVTAPQPGNDGPNAPKDVAGSMWSSDNTATQTADRMLNWTESSTSSSLATEMLRAFDEL